MGLGGADPTCLEFGPRFRGKVVDGLGDGTLAVDVDVAVGVEVDVDVSVDVDVDGSDNDCEPGGGVHVEFVIVGVGGVSDDDDRAVGLGLGYSIDKSEYDGLGVGTLRALCTKVGTLLTAGKDPSEMCADGGRVGNQLSGGTVGSGEPDDVKSI